MGDGLAGKVAIVTGASSGIGEAIARAFSAEGAAVVLAARRVEKLQAIAAELEAQGGAPLVVPCDVTSEAEVEHLFEATMERHGRLDLLVNNAGVTSGAPLDEFSLELWQQVVATNLTGPFLCSRAALRIMKRQQGGRIINIGSLSALRVRPNTAAYSSTKHGIWGLTQVTALEGRPFGITCGCLQPGNTLAEHWLDPNKPIKGEPLMPADQLARAAVLMASLPPDINLLEAVILPIDQLFVGRG
jgi:NAD(P)-dependent dehydrogenase (short-subunit alcohol dehydrogenase family)